MLCRDKDDFPASFLAPGFCHFAYNGEGVSGEEARQRGSYRRGGDGGDEGIIQSGWTSPCGSAIRAVLFTLSGGEDQEFVQAGSISVSALEEASLKSENVDDGTGELSVSELLLLCPSS